MRSANALVRNVWSKHACNKIQYEPCICLPTKIAIPELYSTAIYSTPGYFSYAIHSVLINNTSDDILSEIFALVPHTPGMGKFLADIFKLLDLPSTLSFLKPPTRIQGILYQVIPTTMYITNIFD
jgi:hypothetical protein